MIFAKYVFLAVVVVSVVLLVRSAKRMLELKVALCFERGFTTHYALVKSDGGEGQAELLCFTVKHLSFSDVLFLLLCWFVRVGEPKTTLFNLRFPTLASQREDDALNVCPVREVRPINLNANDDLRNEEVLSDGAWNKLSNVFEDVFAKTP